MRGLHKLAPTSSHLPSAAAQSFLSSHSSHAFSSFSGAGRGGGSGRGRGVLPPRVPGQPIPPAVDDADSFVSPSPPIGHGRGSSPVLPSFPSWLSPSAGRGRGLSHPPPADPVEPHHKAPIFFRRDADSDPRSVDPAQPEPAPLPRILSTGVGRGKPPKPADPDPRSSQENRHLRPRPPAQRASPSPSPSSPSEPTPDRPVLSQEERVKKAMERLSRGQQERAGGMGRGGDRGARRRWTRRDRDEDQEFALDLGNNADGEKLKERLGEAKMKVLEDAFEEVTANVLPSPLEDAYLNALHTNNLIEYEPEYLMEFDRNPDIDEEPPMPLRDVLEKVKPFIMAYEGIQSQEEWEAVIEETMEKVPVMKELIDMYCGPDRVTAKQQQQELQRVAKTLPENVPSSVKSFTDRAVLSLQSNPGWGWDKKCQFMDKLVWEVSQQYK